MRARLAALPGANRPRIVAVFGTTRTEIECAVRHVRTGAVDLPIWAWCAEECGDIPGCERLTADGRLHAVSRELREAWPALSVVAWTGKPAPVGLKLLPLVTPPFRVLLFNEAGGFFAARPAGVASHLARRVRDACTAKRRYASDWCKGAAQWSGSHLWDAAQWLFWRIVNAAILLGQIAKRAARRIVRMILGLKEPICNGAHWLRESALAVLAFSAQPLAPLTRAAVGRASGRVHCPLGSGPVEVSIPNRVWPRRAVLSAAANSEAEFIVFRMRGELASAEPLIAIARATNAFAVARQMAYGGWRKKAVHKHPFRRLQEGEVSEVFAPFSSLIIFRRSVLLRVGIPRALTYGGALLILFWKSSATGLCSLVAGHRGTVSDEPAMALEEAELALRLTLSSSLRALKPTRLRGNIAWSERHRPAVDRERQRPRVLVVSPYLPWPLSHGGAVRIYNLCRVLSRHVDFVLACFRESGETICYDELHAVFREVYVVDSDEKLPDPSVPKQVTEYRNSAMSDLIRGLCLSHSVDIVQLEYTQLAEYREDTGAIPVVLVEHDITFTLYRQIAEYSDGAPAQEEYRRWLDFERAALQCSNVVWTMSAEERSVALAHGASARRTQVIPNGVDLDRFRAMPPAAGRPVVLFVGSFRHLPNLLAFEELRDSIMPAVWTECPEAVLHVIAGPQHERAAELAGRANLLLPDPRIMLEGFVADVRPAYCSAAAVAVPLPLSAGTNIKLLEAMACGRAIVSTPAGCRGLDLTDGKELLIAEVDEFARALAGLLRDDCLRAGLASEARKSAEERFGWDAIARDALDCYVELSRAEISRADSVPPAIRSAYGRHPSPR